jgi:hypothetical protein
VNKEELYELALSDVPTYSLLNEIFAIRDKRVEIVDYTIGVNGFISLDVLNKYVKIIQENQQLKEKLNGVYEERDYLFNKLSIEKKYLQERINKAMEYMKYNATSNYFDKEKNMYRREEDLLEILKGEN